MKDLKTLLDQDITEKSVVKELYTKIWKQDLRSLAAIISEHIEDPEDMLKKLASYVQTARNVGFKDERVKH